VVRLVDILLRDHHHYLLIRLAYVVIPPVWVVVPAVCWALPPQIPLRSLKSHPRLLLTPLQVRFRDRVPNLRHRQHQIGLDESSSKQKIERNLLANRGHIFEYDVRYNDV
jgi:hypothetical protein